MKLTNDMNLYISSMGKLFLVTHICNSIDEANKIMSENPETTCISEDDQGIIYLAKNDCLIDFNKLQLALPFSLVQKIE